MFQIRIIVVMLLRQSKYNLPYLIDNVKISGLNDSLNFNLIYLQ